MEATIPAYGQGYVLTGMSLDAQFFATKHWGPLVGHSDAAAIDLGDAGAVERIVVGKSGRATSFETGNLSEPFRALNACSMDLLQHWGLRADQHAGHSPVELKNERLEVGKLQRKFAKGPGRKRHVAILNLQAIVESDGSVSDCFFEIAVATGGGNFDACADVRKMQFRPAQTAAGEPMRSFYAASIPLSWVDPLAL